MRGDVARPLRLLGMALLLVGMIAVIAAPASRAGDTKDNADGQATLAAVGACAWPPAMSTAAPPTCVLPASNVTQAGDDEAIDLHIQRCNESSSSVVMFDGPRITEC